jgi:hypothetical protein
VKKIVRYVSATLVVLPIVLPLLFTLRIDQQRRDIFHSMKERLEKEQLTSVCLNVSEVVWVKAGKEIAFHGHMFDLKSYYIDGNKMYVQGLYDEDEKTLNNVVNHQMKKTYNGYNQLFQQLFQLLRSSNRQDVIDFNYSGTTSFQQAYENCETALTTTLLSVLTPPPKC